MACEVLTAFACAVYGANYELSAYSHVVGVVDDVKRQEFSDADRPSFYSFEPADIRQLASPSPHRSCPPAGRVSRIQFPRCVRRSARSLPP
jgi:hypothetical protein